MTNFYNTKCKFICKQLGTYTSDLHRALQWEKVGFDVLFYYNGKYVGELIYGGEIDDVLNIPDEAPYGEVFLCGKDFYCHIQEEVLKSKPLIKHFSITYSEFLIS